MPIHQASPKPVDVTTMSRPKGVAGDAAGGSRPLNVEEEVVDLSMAICLSLGLRNDLRVCSYRACKVLVSHLATPVEDEFLSGLSNIEVVRPAYQSLGQGLLAQEQVEKIKKLEDILEPKSKQLADAEERVQLLEGEKTKLVTKLAQAEMERHKLVWEFDPVVSKRLHMSVEYRKSLVVPIVLFLTAGWLGGLSLRKTEADIAAVLSETSNLDIKVEADIAAVLSETNNLDIKVEALMKLTLDVPPTNIEPDPSAEANDGGGDSQAPLDIQATSSAPSQPVT
ncbi:hypothetical protein Tco_0729242 [Tanacetum coccineum]|uniref:Uncharacterized protein n=1 Tax=Tanacetum coccineum TaxID=301880 RepID=A0ABQ4YPL5_9ASTR